MSAKVHAPHGVFDFPQVEKYRYLTGEGLDLLDNDGEIVTSFDAGHWCHVELFDGETVEDSPEVDEPRTFTSLHFVPFSKGVRDKDGDLYTRIDGYWCWHSQSGPEKIDRDALKSWDSFAPFTEVIE